MMSFSSFVVGSLLAAIVLPQYVQGHGYLRNEHVGDMMESLLNSLRGGGPAEEHVSITIYSQLEPNASTEQIEQQLRDMESFASSMFDNTYLESLFQDMMETTNAMLRGSASQRHSCPCRFDVRRLCRGNVTQMERSQCLFEHMDKLSSGCKEMIEKSPLIKECSNEINQLCSDVAWGENRLHTCLMGHTNALSDSCSRVVENELPTWNSGKVKPQTMLTSVKSLPRQPKLEIDPPVPATTRSPVVDEHFNAKDGPSTMHKHRMAFVLSGVIGCVVIVAIVGVLIKRRRQPQPDYREIGYQPMLI